MKNITEIKKLVEAFYQGNTSQDDEDFLKSYFQSTEIPNELLQDKMLYLAITAAHEPMKIPEGLESRLASFIDDKEIEDTSKKILKPSHKSKKLYIKIGSWAASVCLLITIGLFILDQRNTDSIASTNISKLSRQDQLKLVKAQKAIELVSTQFNKGIDKVKDVSDNIK